MDHLRRFGLDHDELVLAAGCMYVIIRFGIGEILRRYTVHRGMWHSIPAAFIAGLATAFICSCDSPTNRLFKVCAVIIGYHVHLALDEFYSIQWYRGRIRLKKSFGTALKFWGPDPWTNAAVFGKLALLVYLIVNDPSLNGRMLPNVFPTEPTVRQEDEVVGEDYSPSANRWRTPPLNR